MEVESTPVREERWQRRWQAVSVAEPRKQGHDLQQEARGMQTAAQWWGTAACLASGGGGKEFSIFHEASQPARQPRPANHLRPLYLRFAPKAVGMSNLSRRGLLAAAAGGTAGATAGLTAPVLVLHRQQSACAGDLRAPVARHRTPCRPPAPSQALVIGSHVVAGQSLELWNAGVPESMQHQNSISICPHPTSIYPI